MDTLPGVTLQSGVRRRPNAFNLLHQLEFLRRTGSTTEAAVKGLEARAYPVAYPGLRFFYCGSSVNAHKMLDFERVFKRLQTYGLRWLCLLLWEAQESVASIAAAYSLGKQESQAAICLLHKMLPGVRETLTILVRSSPLYFQNHKSHKINVTERSVLGNGRSQSSSAMKVFRAGT